MKPTKLCFMIGVAVFVVMLAITMNVSIQGSSVVSSFQSENAASVHARIYSLNGKLVSETWAASDALSKRLSGLASGIYLVLTHSIAADGQARSAVRKVVITH